MKVGVDLSRHCGSHARVCIAWHMLVKSRQPLEAITRLHSLAVESSSSGVKWHLTPRSQLVMHDNGWMVAGGIDRVVDSSGFSAAELSVVADVGAVGVEWCGAEF